MRVSKLQRQIVEVMGDECHGDGYHWPVWCLTDELSCSPQSLSNSINKLVARGEVLREVDALGCAGSGARWQYRYILAAKVDDQAALEASKPNLSEAERLDRLANLWG